ncbi:MAG: hypothetical protein WA476_20745 [Acidobacteriaceae bacterium]
MKKLAFASVALAGLCGAVACSSAFAQGSDGQAAAGQGAQGAANCSQITIKDAAEYNAYANATSQSSPAAKAQAIEAFLQQYPNSVAKVEMLGDLMDSYRQAGNVPKMLDAAKRLLQADPNNLRAYTAVVYLEHQQSNGNQAMLDDAAAVAQKGLNATKDQCTSQADYDKLKDLATPVFYEAIAADDTAKKDPKDAIDAYTKELQSYKDPTQTTVVPALLDTYYLGNAYLQLDPKDLKNAIWFLTRFSQFAQPPYKQQGEAAAEYWYKKFHCAQNDAACNATPPQGYAQIQQLAAVPANVFPPATYNITPAPPPPSPADLAHQAIVSTAGCANVTPAPPPAAPATPGAAPAEAPAAAPAPAPAASTAPVSAPAACTDALKKSIGLSDEEFILANGDQQDQQLIWSIMNGVTAEIPGVVVTATPDSVQLAVTQDAQQSNNADFTINMKTPLKTAPTPGTKVTYIATFDSYTQKPAMIILKDGEPKAAPKAPVHHPAATHHPAH